jgi:putative transposase
MSGEYPVTEVCEVLMVSRSGYYDWQRRKAEPGRRAQENAALTAALRVEFKAKQGRYGSPRLTPELVARGYRCGRHRVARLMRKARLVARLRSKYRVATTDSRHDGPIAPNRLLGYKESRINEVWVTDVTCVHTTQGWLYLAGVLDRYSRRLVGWAMGSVHDADLVVQALQMALRHRRPTSPVIVHSDRGSQYASAAFRQLLAAHGLTASMSRAGNCYDNAFIESFWSSLKWELVHCTSFATRSAATAAIFEYIETFYNRTRLHSSLGYRSPLTFESTKN